MIEIQRIESNNAMPVKAESNTHSYYRCGNNEKAVDHPRLLWREQELVGAFIREFESFRMPTPEVADWFHDARLSHVNVMPTNDLQQSRARNPEITGRRLNFACSLKMP